MWRVGAGLVSGSMLLSLALLREGPAWGKLSKIFCNNLIALFLKICGEGRGRPN